MKKETRICPNCVTEMHTISKSGRRIIEKRFKKSLKYFWRCPNCGVREEADEPQESQVIKTKNNETTNGTEPYYDCSEENIIYHYIQQKDPS